MKTVSETALRCNLWRRLTRFWRVLNQEVIVDQVLATCLLVTTVHSLQYVTYPNGAVVPSEGAAILAARANHLAAINAANVDHLANNYVVKSNGQAVANSLLDSPSNLVLHPNGAVVPSEDAAILAARAHNLAAQAAHIDLLAKNGLYVPFGYP